MMLSDNSVHDGSNSSSSSGSRSSRRSNSNRGPRPHEMAAVAVAASPTTREKIHRAQPQPQPQPQPAHTQQRRSYGTSSSSSGRGSVAGPALLSEGSSLDHISGSSEKGYLDLSHVYTSSLPMKTSSIRMTQRWWLGGDARDILWRVFGGAGIFTLFVVAVSTLYNGRVWSGPSAAVRGAEEGFPSMMEEKQHHHYNGVSARSPASGGALKVRASNEYGEFDQESLELYSLEMLVEPFRVTTLEADLPDSSELSNNFVWRLRHADSSGTTSQSAKDVWDFTGGSKASVTIEKPGTLYILTVQNLDDAGGVIAECRIKVSCKYVRRELRQLTEEDRVAFFDTMHIFYTISTADGRDKYGQTFDNYELIVAYHNSKITDYCYHDGLQFLTSHAAFDLWMDRYLQMINPKVTLPIWDFMIEASTMGDEWYNSVVFDRDWFGSAIGSPENSFMVSEGRFSEVSTIYDPDKKIANKGGMRANHNAYGYVTSTRNYQDLPRLTRTSSYCGLTSHATFATTETLVACFKETTLYDWENCMETKVHGDLHGLLGGGFNCNTDMRAFAAQHPEYDLKLLSFVLEYMTFNYWPMNGFISSANTCDTSCDRGQTEPCGCTCNIDAFSISDQETYDYCKQFMSDAADKFTGDEFITLDTNATYPYGFLKDDGDRMSDEEALLLMRYLVKIGCEPGSVGYMSTGASPLDPIFWVLHPMFEKALHILWLSPKYSATFDFEWVDGTCTGSAYDDNMPFSEEMLGLGHSKELVTNERLLELMHPSNPGLPYIYDDFSNWGNTATDLL